MVRLLLAAACATMLAACSGPFFYHDVIVPTYRQVDVPPPAQPATQP